VTQTQVGTNITGQNSTRCRRWTAAVRAAAAGSRTDAHLAAERSRAHSTARAAEHLEQRVHGDGAYNNDDRTQSGPGMQTRMTVDTTANTRCWCTISARNTERRRRGDQRRDQGRSNQFHGRAAYYLQTAVDATTIS